MPKSRTRRRPVPKPRPPRRSGPATAPAVAAVAVAAVAVATTALATPSPSTPGGPPGPEWDSYRPLFAALDEPGFSSWVDGLAAVRALDALLSGAAPPTEVHDAAARAWLLRETGVRCRLLVEDADGVRPGPHVVAWASADVRARTCFRAFAVVAAAEVVVRSLPGRSYQGEQATSLLADVVSAAVGPRPWRTADLEGLGSGLHRLFVVPEVLRGVERLRWWGLLDAGAELAASPQGRPLLEVLARLLAEQPVPEPRHPDSRVTGPTYEVEASTEVAGERRVRVVRLSGSSTVDVLTDLLITVFGLRRAGRVGLLTGSHLWPRLADPGLLTAVGADRSDPWTLAVGQEDALEESEAANAVVTAASVSVTSLVEHLGDRWELPLSTWGDADVEDPVLQVRVVRAVSADDSRGLVFPSCLAGTGDHLAGDHDGGEDGDEDGDSAGGAAFDLDAVEAQVAGIHRGRW